MKGKIILLMLLLNLTIVTAGESTEYAINLGDSKIVQFEGQLFEVRFVRQPTPTTVKFEVQLVGTNSYPADIMKVGQFMSLPNVGPNEGERNLARVDITEVQQGIAKFKIYSTAATVLAPFLGKYSNFDQGIDSLIEVGFHYEFDGNQYVFQYTEGQPNTYHIHLTDGRNSILDSTQELGFGEIGSLTHPGTGESFDVMPNPASNHIPDTNTPEDLSILVTDSKFVNDCKDLTSGMHIIVESFQTQRKWCFVAMEDHVTLVCDPYFKSDSSEGVRILGSYNSIGFAASGKNNVEVIECKFHDHGVGIRLDNVNNARVARNTVHENANLGMYLSNQMSNSRFDNNVIFDSTWGIGMMRVTGTNNKIRENAFDLSNNGLGAHQTSASAYSLEHNSFNNHQNCIAVTQGGIPDLSTNSFSNCIWNQVFRQP